MQKLWQKVEKKKNDWHEKQYFISQVRKYYDEVKDDVIEKYHTILMQCIEFSKAQEMKYRVWDKDEFYTQAEVIDCEVVQVKITQKEFEKGLSLNKFKNRLREESKMRKN